MDTTSIRLELPPDLVKSLESENIPAEQVAAQILITYAPHRNVKPLIIGDDDRRKLERLLSRNFTTPDELIQQVQRIMTVSVEGCELTLSKALLDRLKARSAYKTGTEFKKFVAEKAVFALEKIMGLK